MNSIIDKTFSCCPVCYEEIDATIEYDDNAVWMKKVCTEHGGFRTKIEEDPEFYKNCSNGIKYPNVLLLNSTDRCNIQCPNCYHPINNSSKDPPITELVEKSLQFEGSEIVLLGAEPTMREDLIELIKTLSEHGKSTSMVTNGVKLAKMEYISNLYGAGMQDICVSLHHRTYNTERIYQLKLKALNNLRKLDEYVSHVAFTLRSLNELGDVLNDIENFSDFIEGFRIRTGYNIGYNENPDEFVFLSTLLKKLTEEAETRNKTIEINPNKDNNVYHINVFYDSYIKIRLISIPDVNRFDFSQSLTPPWAHFNDFISNFCHSILIQEARTKGLSPFVSEKMKMTKEARKEIDKSSWNLALGFFTKRIKDA